MNILLVEIYSLQLAGRYNLGHGLLRTKYKYRKVDGSVHYFYAYYIQKFLNKATELTRYMSIIRDAASRSLGFGWRTYDAQFRLRQSIMPQSWAKVNPDLWLRLLSPGVGGASMAIVYMHRQSGMGAKNSNTLPQENKVCFAYNKDSCTWKPCQFQHICSICLANHPRVS